jgi:hypothetical protein
LDYGKKNKMIDEDFLCGEIPVKEIIEENDWGSKCTISQYKESYTNNRFVRLRYDPRGRNSPGPCKWVFDPADIPLAFVALGKFLRANGMELPK